MRGEIWLGDLVRALDAVPPSGRDDAVAAMLGFVRRARPAPPAAGRPTVPRPAPAEVPEPPVAGVYRRTAAKDPASSGDAAPFVTPAPARSRPVEPTPPGSPPRPSDRPPGSGRAAPVGVPLLFPADDSATQPTGAWRTGPLPASRAGRREPNPAHQLFSPRSSAAILHLALAQLAPDGPVDVTVLVHRLARGEPIETLPRRPTLTLRFGVDVLVDMSVGMEPFARDVRDLLRQTTRVAGPGQVRTRRFANVPTRGAGPGPRRDWRPYRPPHRRGRVLVVSDFGMGGDVLDHRRATVEDWAEFTRDLSRHGCQAVALTPYPRRRWPGWLPALLPVLPWDRKVTVGEVSARLGGR